MKKKTDRKKLTDRLDKLCHDIIIIRDENKCQKCGKHIEGQNAHCSHVIPRSHGNKLRWDLWNLKLLCFHHHISWWHKNPIEAAEWFKNKFPDRWEYLEANKNIIKKWTIEDLKELIKYYEKYLKEMQFNKINEDEQRLSEMPNNSTLAERRKEK